MLDMDTMDIIDTLAIRHARYLEQEARRVADEALIAGAFPADFKVVHIYRSKMPFGTELG